MSWQKPRGGRGAPTLLLPHHMTRGFARQTPRKFEIAMQRVSFAVMQNCLCLLWHGDSMLAMTALAVVVAIAIGIVIVIACVEVVVIVVVTELGP